jgi:hypothetical protein
MGTDLEYRLQVAERQSQEAQLRLDREKARRADEAPKVRKEKENFAKEHDNTLAYTVSKQFIRNQLKAPSSADFPGAATDAVSVAKTGDAKYLVSAYVDAKTHWEQSCARDGSARLNTLEATTGEQHPVDAGLWSKP